jgi:hypothetical protein
MKIKNLFRSGIMDGRRAWTIPFLVLFGSFLADFLPAQTPPSEPSAPPSEIAPQQLSPEQLKTLLAPIALYPDALVALILPASTVPSDLVLAARYITSNGDAAQVANQPWDDSVKSLVRYPDVLKWMDQNLDWTTALGEAFLDQPADVMNAIQGLRMEAIAAGNLADSPQQRVVQEETVIRIVPAEPDVIYVPQYDPDVVYVQPYSQNFGPLLTFEAGFAVGSWLNYDCDWRRRGIYVGQWRPGWNHGRDWDRGDNDRNWDRGDQGRNWNRGDRSDNLIDVVNINSDTARQWQPSANSQRRQARQQRSNRANARLSNTSVQDANEQPGGSSTASRTRNFDPRAIQVPKPSRPDFTSQRNEGIRRDSQPSDESTSAGSPPAPNVSTDATPAARGKNQKVSAPTVAPNVPGEQGAAIPSRGQRGSPRNLNKQDSAQDMAPNASEATAATPGTQSKNEKKSAPTVAPNVPSEQGAPGKRSGKGGNARNLNKQDNPQDMAPNASEGPAATPGTQSKNEKKSAPTVAPNVPSEQGAPGKRNAKGGNARNLNKQDNPQDMAPNASEGPAAMPGARSKNEKKSAPTVAPNVQGEQGAPGQSGGQGGSPRKLNKDAQGSRSKDGANNQPSDVPTQKHIDRSSPPQSKSAPHPSNGQKHEQKPVQHSAPPLAKQNKPSQPAAERQDKQRPAVAVDQNTAPRPSNAPRGKGNGKGGGEKKTDEKKNKSDN